VAPPPAAGEGYRSGESKAIHFQHHQYRLAKVAA